MKPSFELTKQHVRVGEQVIANITSNYSSGVQYRWLINQKTVHSNNCIRFCFEQPGSYQVGLVSDDLPGSHPTFHWVTVV